MGGAQGLPAAVVALSMLSASLTHHNSVADVKLELIPGACTPLTKPLLVRLLRELCQTLYRNSTLKYGSSSKAGNVV